MARANRQSQARFSCTKYGYRANADFKAAPNMRDRARVKVSMVAGWHPQQLLLLAGVGASDKLRPAGRST